MSAPHIIAVAAVVAALPLAATTASASVFSETFDTEETGPSELNYIDFDQFTISDGTVDLIREINAYGISCYGGTGYCVDLDGSSGMAGKMTSDLFALDGGETYTLSFAISGNQRGGASDTLDFGIDGGPSWQITRDAADPWELLSYDFSVASDGNFSLFFDLQGGDNAGMILDSVSVLATAAPIPLPAALPLLAAGLGSLAIARRRKN